MDIVTYALCKKHIDDTTVPNTRTIAGLDLENDISVAELQTALNVEDGANKTVVDSSLSSSSTNPVQNKKVYEALQGKYNVQTNGIPKSDLASAVQTSLNKADSAATQMQVQNLQSQIDEIITPVTQDAEIQNARVDANGVTHGTLKERLDSDYNQLNKDLSDVKQSVDSIGKYSDNLFDKENATNGKFYKATAVGDVITTNDNSNYYCFIIPVKPNTDYIIKQISYTLYITDENDIVLRVNNGSAQQLSDYTVNTGNNAVKMFVSVNRNSCLPEDMMVVEGTELPEEYSPYGFDFSVEVTKSIKKIANVEEVSTSIENLSAEITDYKKDVGEQSANLFDKTTITTGRYYFAASVGDEVELKSNSAFYCFIVPVKPNTDYIIKQISCTLYITDANGTVLTIKNGGAEAHSDYTFNTGSNARFIYVSTRDVQCSPDAMMVVAGTALPETYLPYGFIFSENAEYSIKKLSKEANSKIYTVGIGKDYETFTACIRDLKDDDTPKDIYIDSGIYDIYEEMGGEEFVRSIPEGETKWRNVCDIVPPNTRLIGIGYVEFRYFPTYSTSESANLISPVNIATGNVSMENIRVIGRNCRYTIHDDASGTNKNVTHTYKNVYCQKVGGGYTQAFGSGIGENCIIEFYNCIILSNRLAFSVHNQWYAEFGKILFSNCIIQGNNNYADVRLGSLSTRDTSYPIEVTFMNCKLNEIQYANEDSNPARTIPYMVTVCNSGTPTFDDSAFSENQFPPVIY